MSVAARTVWLKELARAIEEAQRLAWRLGIVEGRSQALDLYVRLEIARAEVEALRERGTELSAADPSTGVFPAADTADAPEA